MNKTHTLKKAAAAFLALALTVGATGCSFLVTDNEKDLKQTIATVNVAKTMASDEAYKDYADDVQALIDKGGLATDIPKRDLVAYFLSAGYYYVQSYGYTYEDTFNMLIDGLVEQKILTQYAVAYYLKNGEGLSVDKCMEYTQAELAKASDKEKALLSAHPQALTMKYFLTEGGADNEAYDEAVYSLKQSLNSSLDSAEANYITATDEDEHTHDETRTTPTNVNTQKEDYIPMKDGKLDYEIYTGRNALDACGTYEKVDGSTVTSRKKAYNSFLSNLQGYGLIKEGEDTAVVTELDYYYLELSNTLANALVNKYGEDLQETATDFLSKEYVEGKYNDIYEAQKTAYEKDSTAFDTALDSVSDTSFILYGQKDFGFVYNILIPFSATQEAEYAVAKNKGLTQEQLLSVRRDLLTEVEAKDLRSAWFCADNEDEHYAYEATAAADGDYYGAKAGDKGYLFFENNFAKTDEYETLSQYLGKYAYNGTATLDGDEWKFEPTTMKIGSVAESGFIQEMEAYIEYAVGGDVIGEGTYPTAYKGDYVGAGGKVDYSKFIYYTNKVTLTNKSRSDFFNKKVGKTDTVNDSYAALSAVNELMFAYSTDTGCLNTYMGYVVSPYKTDFVSEFEYAAQYVVLQGVGSYAVVPSDYGWHIIYCSFVYDADDGAVYGGYKHDEREVEGTFSYLFYESLKSTASSSYTTAAQNDILNRYNDENSVTKYEKTYKDLLELDA